MSGSVRLRSSKACLVLYNSRWAGVKTLEISVAITATATTVTAYDLRAAVQVVKNRIFLGGVLHPISAPVRVALH